MSECLVCCLDAVAKCMFVIFDKKQLPRIWGESLLLNFVVPINIFLLLLSTISDWLVFGYCADTLLKEPKSQKVSNSTEDVYDHYANVGFAFYVTYLTCSFAGTLFCVFHVVANCFVLILKRWNPPLSMWLEILTLLLNYAALPTLLCLTLALIPICIDFYFCQWQLLFFTILKVMCILWCCFKLVHLGLCCCCCATLCTTSWPLHKKVRKNKRGDNLMTNVLRWMPVDSESSTWAQAGKWCFLSVWTFPLAILGLLASACLIAVVFMNNNFLFPCKK